MEHKMGKDTCLNIIFDDRQPEDKGRLLEEFRIQGITEYKFWDAIVLTDSVVKSINASHKMIVRYAKENGLPQIIVGEQDLAFTDTDAWDYYLKNTPKEFDIYLGCSYVPPITNLKICGFHLYTVREQFYDRFLSVPDDSHIDTAVCDLKPFVRFCYPFPALQRSGYSSNNKAIVDYNKILEPKDIYKK